MVAERPLWQSVAERIIALLMLILLVPTFCIIAILIKMTSPGPWLSRQRAIGLNEREFYLYKFRVRDDGYLTAVGRFLREYALDGLPQFWNVVIGDMGFRSLEWVQKR